MPNKAEQCAGRDEGGGLDRILGDGGADPEELSFEQVVDSPVQMTMRIATQPIDINDRAIAPGTVVVLCTGAANRDPTAFAHPDRLDWHRHDNSHLAFGGGIHYCLGAQLARAEARIGLRALLDHIPNPTLAAEPRRRPSFTIRGLECLDLNW